MGGDGSGRGGVTPHKVRRVEKLLEQGKRREWIAQTLRIGLTTVRRIELGEHFLQLAMDVAAYQRCPGCGALIETETCLLCELRKAGL